LKYHGEFKELNPDDTFESYFENSRTRAQIRTQIKYRIGQIYRHYVNIDRYAPYVKMCNAKCSYTKNDKDRID
jgi:hypothetical protein